MENTIQRESRFSRTLNNHAKLGAYYTDPAHCKAIASFLEFPKEGEILALEPSIGDGVAVLSALRKEEGDNKHIYGCDINEQVVSGLQTNPLIENVICGDFLTGVNMTKGAFDICFSNPPYMTQGEQRMEDLFLEKITALLKRDGVLVYVIPYSVFIDRAMFRKIYNRYDIKHVYRFHADEYAKWHQVVIIGTRRKIKENVLKDELDREIGRYSDEQAVPELPFSYAGEKVTVPSGEDQLKIFTTVEFPAEACRRAMNEGAAKSNLSAFMGAMGAKISTPKFFGGEKMHPPIHPNKDSMYLLGVCGAGSGLCGNEEEGNLHLQRGTVKMVEEVKEGSGEGDKNTVIVTKRAMVTYKVIQADGTIRSLE